MVNQNPSSGKKKKEKEKQVLELIYEISLSHVSGQKPTPGAFTL